VRHREADDSVAFGECERLDRPQPDRGSRVHPRVLSGQRGRERHVVRAQHETEPRRALVVGGVEGVVAYERGE